MRSVREAKAIADKIKKDHASAIAGREPAIEETVVGNMGTFYRVSVGPFADAKESQAVCGKLRAGGFDCLMLTH